MKLMSPDYKGMNEAKAREDFRRRLENYERAYQPLEEGDEDDEIQYCKLINVGKKVRKREGGSRGVGGVGGFGGRKNRIRRGRKEYRQ